MAKSSLSVLFWVLLAILIQITSLSPAQDGDDRRTLAAEISAKTARHQLSVARRQFWLTVGSMSVTALVTVLAGLFIPLSINRARNRSDRIKTTLDISRILYDREFYIYVTAPTWEIAVKWLYWDGSDGDEYRWVVSGTKFLYKYKNFELPEEANSQLYQNLIRFEPHTMPYGYRERTTAISELSEHQALNVWIQFWCSLQALLEKRLVDESLVRRLFADWYEAWLEFMLQLRFVGEDLKRGVSWFSQIEKIENVLFQNNAAYKDAVAKAKKQAEVIVEKTRELDSSGPARVSRRTAEPQRLKMFLIILSRRLTLCLQSIPHLIHLRSHGKSKRSYGANCHPAGPRSCRVNCWQRQFRFSHSH